MIFLLIILMVISFFLESIIPSLLSNFFPLFIIAIILIGSMFNIDDNKYYLLLFIVGIIYDLTYMNTIVLDGFIFLFIGYLARIITNADAFFIKNLFLYYVLSLTYVLFFYLFTFLYVPQNPLLLFNKILGGVAINTIYFTFMYFIFIGLKKIISNRRKKRSYF